MKSVKKITTIKKREKKERQRLIKNHLNLHAPTIHRSFQTTLTGTKKNKRKWKALEKKRVDFPIPAVRRSKEIFRC